LSSRRNSITVPGQQSVEVETDDDGIAELDVEETRAGSYVYKAYLSTDKNKVR
jgi:hypothetical protein